MKIPNPRDFFKSRSEVLMQITERKHAHMCLGKPLFVSPYLGIVGWGTLAGNRYLLLCWILYHQHHDPFNMICWNFLALLLFLYVFAFIPFILPGIYYVKNITQRHTTKWNGEEEREKKGSSPIFCSLFFYLCRLFKYFVKSFLKWTRDKTSQFVFDRWSV